MEVKTYLTENEHLLRKHNRIISAVNKALKENSKSGITYELAMMEKQNELNCNVDEDDVSG